MANDTKEEFWGKITWILINRNLTVTFRPNDSVS